MGVRVGSGLSVLVGAVKGQRRDVALGAFLGSAHQAGEALVPVLIGVLIDGAVGGGDLGALLGGFAVLAVVYVGLSLSFRYGARASERAAESARHQLRLAVVGRVLHPGGGTEEGRLPGALTAIATEDARRVGAAARAVAMGLAALAGLAVGAVVLLRTSLPLGLVVLAGTPLLLWAGHLLSRPLERRSAAEQERAGHASGVAADLVSGLRVLKGIHAEAAAVGRYRRTSRDALSATLGAARAEAAQRGIVLALTGCFIALVALIGGRLALSGSISLGELVSAVGLALFLLTPLETLSWVNSELAQARASAVRVAAVLATPPAVTADGAAAVTADGTADGAAAVTADGTANGVAAVTADGAAALRTVRGGLRLRGVTHGGLRALDLDVAPGELLGVAAADPADATALLRCLGRQADPEAGTVELDGVSLRRLDPADIRLAILVAEHGADLFDGTLMENVTVAAPPAGGAQGPPPDGVRAALAAAGADEVVASLPLGGDTLVGARGGPLSGGQRQRVALARALAAARPVLVVHDPTTAVDAVTEARIATGLRDLRQGRTTVLVTTSPALLAIADRVVLIDGGRVTGTGTHAALVRSDPAYRAAVLG
jgi:putative ABC transport system ATP-binding protein